MTDKLTDEETTAPVRLLRCRADPESVTAEEHRALCEFFSAQPEHAGETALPLLQR